MAAGTARNVEHRGVRPEPDHARDRVDLAARGLPARCIEDAVAQRDPETILFVGGLHGLHR